MLLAYLYAGSLSRSLHCVVYGLLGIFLDLVGIALVYLDFKLVSGSLRHHEPPRGRFCFKEGGV
jgi:hypothetical protein